jgi:two-component system, LuxR family, response regulator FixJ
MRDERIVHVVDDDPVFRRSIEALLESAGFATRAYDSALAVLNAASQLSGGCMLLDFRMPGINGLELQASLNELGIRLPVIVMTGQGDVATAVQAMKAGAVDFIEKPFDDDLLLTTIETALAAAAGGGIPRAHNRSRVGADRHVEPTRTASARGHPRRPLNQDDCP